MKYAVLFLLLTGIGCTSNYTPTESSGPVYIRSTQWGNRSVWSSIVFEYDNGSLKSMDRVCENVVPAWPGMRANLQFVWNSDHECYHIISVQHLN